MTNDSGTIQAWERVPLIVAHMLPMALRMQQHHTKIAENLGLLAHTALTWLPERNEFHVYPQFAVSARAQDLYKVAMFDAFSPKTTFVAADTKPNWADEILIKRGALFPAVGKAWDFANNALGGSRPLSNALVSGLALSGLGYGGGMLLENLFPERYVERGKLRKTLAMAGALGGLGIGASNAYANARATGNPYWKGWFISNNTPVPTGEYKWPHPPLGTSRDPAAIEPAPQQSRPQTTMVANNGLPLDSGFKTANDAFPNISLPSIPVDAFNRVVWNDVQKGSDMYNSLHTPPALASATTGLVSGFGAMANSPIISPATVISGLASAGVGLATAHLAGRTLGALAGLTPEAQNKLQDMGMWAGMLHAVIPPVLGQLR